ncbi:hypothetical protein CXB51_010054 [Gossypium anomalum]|uniref:Uncharacterized protein n=1 Tax=Gossypium anomalum TaxID=47600 RepID=A0A8J6D6E2_9ROSI|nr:hypothetical protein CXB51_010054 [Gossypium anomalum]
MALTHNSFQVKIMVVFLAIMLLMSSAAARSGARYYGRKNPSYYDSSSDTYDTTKCQLLLINPIARLCYISKLKALILTQDFFRMALTHNSFQVKIMVVFLAIMLLMSSAAARSRSGHYDFDFFRRRHPRYDNSPSQGRKNPPYYDSPSDTDGSTESGGVGGGGGRRPML